MQVPTRRHPESKAWKCPRQLNMRRHRSMVSRACAPFPRRKTLCLQAGTGCHSHTRTNLTAPFPPQSAALTRESKASLLTKYPCYDPKDPMPTAGLGAAHDDVCHDTGSAAPSGSAASYSSRKAVTCAGTDSPAKAAVCPRECGQDPFWKCEFPSCFHTHKELHLLCPACIITALMQL